MPELPDLVHIEHKLREALLGRTITAARAGDPTVLRIMVTLPFPETLVGRRFDSVIRRGHFMCIGLDGGLTLAINLMLVGRFYLVAPDGRGPKSMALALECSPREDAPAIELRYVDDKRMGKVYVVATDQLNEVPLLGSLGVDIIGPAFTLAEFRKLARRRRDQVRQFLMDKTALASIGNAYADEILFAARLHPKTFVKKLAPEDIDRLYTSIREVTARAIDEIAGRDLGVEVKVRDFLLVRGRAGKPCPTCGATIREVRVGDGDACFCPQCQPATRALFVDWSKLPGKP
jgi:formamidopyrimidine-DNA glycosylase